MSGFRNDIRAEFRKANGLLIEGRKEEARRVSDQVFLSEFLELDDREISIIRDHFKVLMSARNNRSRPNNDFGPPETRSAGPS